MAANQFILGDGLSGVLGEIAQHFKAFRPQLYLTGGPKQAKPLQIKRQRAENQFHFPDLTRTALRRQREVSGLFHDNFRTAIPASMVSRYQRGRNSPVFGQLDLMENTDGSRRFRHLRHVLAFTMVLAGASAGTTSICLGGDDWPARAVKVIVPFAAGSANDVSARLYADGLARRWAKPVIVENKPGADAIVGGGAFANAKDDHTLLYGTASMVTVSPLLQEVLPYDPSRDMVPISSTASSIFVIAVHDQLPVRSLQELAQLARSKPGELSWSSGPSLPHFVFAAMLGAARAQASLHPLPGCNDPAGGLRRGARTNPFPCPAGGQRSGGRRQSADTCRHESRASSRACRTFRLSQRSAFRRWRSRV